MKRPFPTTKSDIVASFFFFFFLSQLLKKLNCIHISLATISPTKPQSLQNISPVLLKIHFWNLANHLPRKYENRLATLNSNITFSFISFRQAVAWIYTWGMSFGHGAPTYLGTQNGKHVNS